MSAKPSTENHSRRIAVLVRTNTMDDKVGDLLRTLSMGRNFDVYACVNETRGAVDVSPYKKIAHTLAMVNTLGLDLPTEYDLLRVSDQVFYLASLQLKQYGFCLFIENDVQLSYKNPSFIEGLVEKLGSLAYADVDFIGTHNRISGPEWYWYADCRRVFDEVHATFFPFIGLSDRALNHLYEKRLEEHRNRPPGSPYIFCEAFVPSALNDAKRFRLEDINAIIPGAYHFNSFNLTFPQIMEEAAGENEKVQMMHPVYTTRNYLERKLIVANVDRKWPEFIASLQTGWPSLTGELRAEFQRRAKAAQAESGEIGDDTMSTRFKLVLVGAVDALHPPNRFSGWIQAVDNPTAPLSVRAVLDGAVIAMTQNDIVRPDTGSNGFIIELPFDLTPERILKRDIRIEAVDANGVSTEVPFYEQFLLRLEAKTK